MSKGTYIDFSELARPGVGRGFSSSTRFQWRAGLCSVCFRPKTACWDTGEADTNGKKRKRSKADKGATANG